MNGVARKAVKPLERYALILEILSRFPDGLSLTEIAVHAQLPKGTTHRMMKALTGIGFVAGGGGRVSYRLGTRLLRMLHVGQAPTWIAGLVDPVLQALVQEYGETAFLAKLVGFEVASVAMAVPKPTARSYVNPGRVMPPNAAASAKAIMAHQSDDILKLVFARQRLVRYTPNTCVDLRQLKRQFAQIRSQGFALCIDELDPGVMSVAVPVQVEGVGTFYSVGLVGLQARLSNFPREQVVTGLKAAAESIVQLLRTRRALSTHHAEPIMSLQ
jgi:DNA-binding IclR family transcriptional regulator